MKVAIYTRVSTHHQIDKDSLPLQREELMNYSKYVLNSNDYVIFEDAGYSGKNTDRPAFQDMIKRIKIGEFSHLLVWKIDRVSRNLLDFCDMYEDLKKYNCIFVSKNEQFDTSSAMGEAMLKIILVFAELERKLTGERVKAVMLDRASKGLWNGAPMPLGYKWDSKIKFPIIDENEKETIENIFKLYLENESTSIVRNYLNANNIKTKREGSWTTKTVTDIIRNLFYTGTYRYNYRESARGRKKKEEEWVLLENNHQAIIDKVTFDKCNEIMNRNALRSNSKFRTNGKTHIFAGLIKCGACLGNYYAKQDKENLDGFRPSIYVCSNRYNKNDCVQKTISEKNIYNFLLQLILNLNSINNKNINYEEFLNIISLNLGTSSVKAEEMFDYIINKKYSFYQLDSTNVKKEVDIKKDIKLKELEKYKRALQRLEELYLFGEDSISSKNYILRKKKIEENIKAINEVLVNENKEKEIEIDFKLLNTVLKNVILEKMDNKSAINLLGRDSLKDFFNSIIKEIFILDKKIISITFKNGLNIGFSY